MHDSWIIAIPTFAVLLGALWNNSRIANLESRMDNGFSNLNRRIDGIVGEFSHFHHTQGQHDARLDALKDRLDKPSPPAPNPR